MSGGEYVSELEMQLRIAKKVDDLLRAEGAAAGLTTLERLTVLGLVLGLVLASAPTDGARKAGAEAHRHGVEQAMALREALERMKPPLEMKGQP